MALYEVANTDHVEAEYLWLSGESRMFLGRFLPNRRRRIDSGHREWHRLAPMTDHRGTTPPPTHTMIGRGVKKARSKNRLIDPRTLLSLAPQVSEMVPGECESCKCKIERLFCCIPRSPVPGLRLAGAPFCRGHIQAWSPEPQVWGPIQGTAGHP